MGVDATLVAILKSLPERFAVFVGERLVVHRRLSERLEDGVCMGLGEKLQVADRWPNLGIGK